MSTSGLAVFVLVSFLLPVPILAWPIDPATASWGSEMYAGHFAAGLALKATPQ